MKICPEFLRMDQRKQELELMDLVTLRGIVATINATIVYNNAAMRLPCWQRFIYSILRQEFPTVPGYAMDHDCYELERLNRAERFADLQQA